MTTIAAVIFDMDDTLYPERTYAFSGFRAVVDSCADLVDDPDLAVDEMGALLDRSDRHRVFNCFVEQRGLSDDAELVQRMIQTFRTHRPTISLHRDAAALLERLRGRFALGLITDGAAVQQQAKVDALGVASLVDEIILTDELGPGLGKPHPAAFELMADRLGVTHERCVYVADNAGKDFVAPNALGWKTVQVLRDDGFYGDAVAPPGGNADHKIYTLADLDAIIAE